ncbi:MAG: VOC family protein [Gammaproteobacteria bacterium]|nr:VOC family protein [Gammaproteobacteria bacterium]
MSNDAKSPIGKLDHIGFAVHSIEEARKFWEDQLGATMQRVVDHHSGDFRLGILDLHGFCIELLEPINPDGFLTKYLEKRGEGIHHITLQTPDLVEKVEDLEQAGVRVVDKHFDTASGGVDAFISPKSSHGVLIQLGQNVGPLNNQPYWEDEEA